MSPLVWHPFDVPLQLLQQATSSSNLGAFSGIQQMAGKSWTVPCLWPCCGLKWGCVQRAKKKKQEKRRPKSHYQCSLLSGLSVKIRVSCTPTSGISKLWNEGAEKFCIVYSRVVLFRFFNGIDYWGISNKDSYIRGSQNDWHPSKILIIGSQ